MTTLFEYAFLAFSIVLWIICIPILYKLYKLYKQQQVVEKRNQRIIEVLSRRLSIDSAIEEDEEADTYYLGSGFANPVYREGDE
uniref:Protein Vpu n=1 Tax=Simian immunodeficiency virus TaxID=11723 RepID=A0A1Z3GV28_SIV|nr:vpu protein [Simian immunodeficiency virus]ASC61746.1 vpu protein [Simian immunodeficiency virus]